VLHFLPKGRDLPTWAQTLEALGHPSPDALARSLGVSARTVARWSAADKAPRSVLLALWFLTPYGIEGRELQLLRERNDYAQLAEALQRDAVLLRQRITWLNEARAYGAANAPFLDPTAEACRPIAASSSRAARGAGRRWRRR
jgi:hypothetical protein